MESMRYITVKEVEYYEMLAKKYKIKGFSIPNSLMCLQPEVKAERKAKNEKSKSDQR